MIIETDFPDHWKCEALIASCGEVALRCLLRLWAFAQIRKSDLLPKKQLEAIAKFQGEKGLFYNTLFELNLIEELGDDEQNSENVVRLHGYAEVNSSLFSRWKNGDKKASKANGKRSGSETQAKAKRTASSLRCPRFNAQSRDSAARTGSRTTFCARRLLRARRRLNVR